MKATAASYQRFYELAPDMLAIVEATTGSCA